MPLQLFAILLILGAIVVVLLLWHWLRRWARFSLRSLVLIVLVIAATGALILRDLSEERVLVEHEHTWHSALSANGSNVAINHLLAAEVWDAKTASRIRSIPAVTCHTLTFSPQGDLLVVGELGEVRVCSLADQTIRRLPEPAAGFGALAPSGQILATGAAEKICLWSWPNVAFVGALVDGLGSLSRDAAWSPDSRRIAVSNSDGETPNGSTTRVYDVNSRQLLYTLPGRCPCYSPDGQVLATLRNNWVEITPKNFSIEDVTLLLWDATDGKPRGKLKSNPGINGITFSREGNLLLAAGSTGLYAWDLATGQCTANYRWRKASTIGGGNLGVSSMVDLPDRQGLLCLSDWDPRLYRWDYRAPWASHPFLGYIEFWVLAVLGLALLVSLVQDLRHFQKVRKEAEVAPSASPAG